MNQSAIAATAGPRELPAEQQEAEVYARNVSGDLPIPTRAFVESDPATVVDAVNAEAFFDSSYDVVLTKMIAHVVEVEGPVLDAVLARRIARVHGWQRTGSKIQARVDAVAATAHPTTSEDVGTFYWATGRGPEVLVAFRRAADDTARAVDEICMPELVSLAREVLASGKTGDLGVTAMARELGLQRLRAASRGRFELAIANAAV